DNGVPAASDSEAITITVGDVNRPPVLSPIGDQMVIEGELLNILLTASDPDGDGWSYSVSGAPTGSSLVDNGDGTATFSWIPDFGLAGNYPVSFTVTDNGVPAASDSEAIIITVGDVNRPPVLSPIGDQMVNEGELLSILLTASDPDGDGWSYSISGAPTGSSFVDNGDGTANFSWTPDFGLAGSYPVSFMVTDDGLPSASDSEAITITVETTGGCEVLSGDLDGDCDVDRDDMNIILAARNTPADGPDDARDLDGDGLITVLDARTLVTLCSRTRCAVE
ncbi:MAG: Ig-like domain-containing protein, partial [Gammaproteobacteria bacterium]|nr:Ig-like domain-containing protein [Gammaproteobacteria bacterium]